MKNGSAPCSGDTRAGGYPWQNRRHFTLMQRRHAGPLPSQGSSDLWKKQL